MKAVRILSRNIRDSFKSVFRNFSLSLASISCITITLIVVAVSIALSFNVNNFTSEVEKDMTIVTFLKTNIDENGREEVLKKLNAMNNIASIKFESKMSIAEDMMQESEIYKNIMSNWTEETNPLQDTYVVKVKDINEIKKTSEEIKKIEGVDNLKYGEGMIEQLVSVFDLIRKICIIAVVALILVTAFLIANTIKITIFSRKREIDIMRLVGASNINIKIPFMLEGLLLGILGSIIPIIMITYGYVAIYEKMDGQVFSAVIKLIEPTPFIYEISALLVVIGMLVGMFGSWRAVKKYLKI